MNIRNLIRILLLGGIFILVASCAKNDPAIIEPSSPVTTTVASTSPRSTDGGSKLVYVQVASVTTEADADSVIALLEENGFEGFTKEEQDGGFNVVAKGLTRNEATALVTGLFADGDVPYKGVIFNES